MYAIIGNKKELISIDNSDLHLHFKINLNRVRSIMKYRTRYFFDEIVWILSPICMHKYNIFHKKIIYFLCLKVFATKKLYRLLTTYFYNTAYQNFSHIRFSSSNNK